MHEKNTVEINNKNCLNCCAFIQFANDVLKDGIVELKLMFTKNFPHMKYTSSKAVRHLMQLPVIIMELALGGPGSQRLYATELRPGIDAQKLLIVKQFLQSTKSQMKDKLPSKEKLAALCQLASSESDRFHVKMAVCSELSGKEAQRQYGIQNLHSKQERINKSLQRAPEIQEVILELANAKEKALLHTLGYDTGSTSCDSDNEDDLEEVEWISSSEDEMGQDKVNVDQYYHCNASLHDCNMSVNKVPSKERVQSVDQIDPDILKTAGTDTAPSQEKLLSVLWENNLNWFSFVKELQNQFATLAHDLESKEQ